MPNEEEQRKITLDHMIDEKFGISPIRSVE